MGTHRGCSGELRGSRRVRGGGVRGGYRRGQAASCRVCPVCVGLCGAGGGGSSHTHPGPPACLSRLLTKKGGDSLRAAQPQPGEGARGGGHRARFPLPIFPPSPLFLSPAPRWGQPRGFPGAGRGRGRAPLSCSGAPPPRAPPAEGFGWASPPPPGRLLGLRDPRGRGGGDPKPCPGSHPTAEGSWVGRGEAAASWKKPWPCSEQRKLAKSGFKGRDAGHLGRRAGCRWMLQQRGQARLQHRALAAAFSVRFMA